MVLSLLFVLRVVFVHNDSLRVSRYCNKRISSSIRLTSSVSLSTSLRLPFILRGEWVHASCAIHSFSKLISVTSPLVTLSFPCLFSSFSSFIRFSPCCVFLCSSGCLYSKRDRALWMGCSVCSSLSVEYG